MSGLQTPSRIGKRTRYNTDAEPLNASTDNEHQEQLQLNHHNENNENGNPPDSQPEEEAATVAAAAAPTAATGPSIQTELEQTKRLVSVFDTIDLSMTEARDKLKTFYKTADETNTLLDMWIRVLSQTEHTQKLLQDPAWEGQSMEEARDREYQERRAAYQQAMEEANRSHSYRVSPNVNHNNLYSTPSLFSSSTSSAATALQAQAQAQSAFGSSSSSIHQNNMYNPSHRPFKKSPSALVAAAHAHASAIAANRKRNAAGGSSTSSGLPRATTATTTTSIVK